MTDVTDVVGDDFRHFNWGKNYEQLVEACQILGQELANPVMYSATRFASSVRKVYMNFRKDYAAIVHCLERTKTEMRDGDSRSRQKAAEAEQLLNYICNVKFVLRLSGLIDIYDKYGSGGA